MPSSFQIKLNGSFVLLLISQTAISLGDTFQLMAVTSLLVKVSGSGLGAGFGLLCAPIPSLFLSAFAGGLGDRFSVKKIMIFLDICRGFMVTLLIGNSNDWSIYFILLLLYSMNSLYNPPFRKLVKTLLTDRDMVAGNALLNGVSGLAYLIGPVLSGVLIARQGRDMVFILNSGAYIFSSFMTVFIKPCFERHLIRYPVKRTGFLAEVGEGLRYLGRVPQLKEMIITGMMVCLGSASINLAFYKLAFDKMKITSELWGLMLSLLYGANISAMLISLLWNDAFTKRMRFFMLSSVLFLCGAWICYGWSGNLWVILAALLMEGNALSLFNILLNARLQIKADKAFTARVVGIYDILSSAAKLAGIFSTAVILILYPLSYVFIFNAILLGFYVLFRLLFNSGRLQRTPLSKADFKVPFRY